MYPGGYKPQDQKLLIEVYPNEPVAEGWPSRGGLQGAANTAAQESGILVDIPTTSAIMTSEVAATPMGSNALREVQVETGMSTRSIMTQAREERAVESGVLVELPPSMINTSEVAPPATDTATEDGLRTVSTFETVMTAPTENTTDDEEYVRLHSRCLIAAPVFRGE